MKNRLKEISRIVSHPQNPKTIHLIQEHIYSLELELNRLESEHNITNLKLNELYNQVPTIQEKLNTHDSQFKKYDELYSEVSYTQEKIDNYNNELYNQVPTLQEKIDNHYIQLNKHDNDIKTLYSLVGVNN